MGRGGRARACRSWRSPRCGRGRGSSTRAGGRCRAGSGACSARAPVEVAVRRDRRRCCSRSCSCPATTGPTRRWTTSRRPSSSSSSGSGWCSPACCSATCSAPSTRGGRSGACCSAGAACAPYPESFGRWPAAIGLLGLHLDRARLGLGRAAGDARHRGRRLQRADADLHGRVRRRAVVALRRGVLGLLQPLLAPVGVRDARPRGRRAAAPRRPAAAGPGAGHGRDRDRDDRHRHVRRAQPGPAVEGPRGPTLNDGFDGARVRRSRRRRSSSPTVGLLLGVGARRAASTGSGSRARARSAATSTRSGCGARSSTASCRSRWSTSPPTT